MLLQVQLLPILLLLPPLLLRFSQGGWGTHPIVPNLCDEMVGWILTAFVFSAKQKGLILKRDKYNAGVSKNAATFILQGSLPVKERYFILYVFHEA